MPTLMQATLTHTPATPIMQCCQTNVYAALNGLTRDGATAQSPKTSGMCTLT